MNCLISLFVNVPSNKLNFYTKRKRESFFTISTILYRKRRNYSRAYLHHLQRVNEILGARLNTLHNLFYYQQLMAELREAIGAGRLADYVAEFHAARSAKLL